MEQKEIQLAKLMLERIKEKPKLTEYLEVAEVPLEEGEISLATLFYHLDNYYNKAATVKSALEFLSENIGIQKTYCILVIAVEDKDLYQMIAKVIHDQTEGFLVAQVKSVEEAETLIRYFDLSDWTCGLFLHLELPGFDPHSLLRDDLPCCAIGSFDSAIDQVRMLRFGANVVIDIRAEDLEKHIQIALVEMFLD